MRQVYRGRRDALLAALERWLPELQPVGASAGLHLLAWLPPGYDGDAIVAAAEEDGIAAQRIGPRRTNPAGPDGIIFGYGSISEAAMDDAVRRLAAVVARVGAATS
jgi:GntR family transcriptional regulator/MocR family aminotransferase